MREIRKQVWVSRLLFAGAVLCHSSGAAACSVCFGDPNSDMARGVNAGVLTLVGVIGFVLLGVVGTGLLWLQRGRRIGAMGDVSTPQEILT